MTNPLYEVEKLPSTSQQAIREFDDRYLAAQGVKLPPSWAEEFGDIGPTNTPLTTFPISQLSGRYQETRGEARFKTMKDTSFDIKAAEFDMGYEAELVSLLTNVFAYRKWNETAGRFTVAEQNHVATKVAALIEAGESTPLTWEDPSGGVNYFSAAHWINFADHGLGTFSNYQSSTKDPNSVPNILAEMTEMMKVPDENGESLDVLPDVIMLPTPKFLIVSTLLSMQQISVASGTGSPGGGTATMTNPLFGKLRPVWNPKLTDGDDWYLVDSKLVRQLPPWVGMRYSPGAPLELRTWDESSGFFRDTGKIKKSSHIWYGFGSVFPHAIRKIKGA